MNKENTDPVFKLEISVSQNEEWVVEGIVMGKKLDPVKHNSLSQALEFISKFTGSMAKEGKGRGF